MQVPKAATARLIEVAATLCFLFADGGLVCKNAYFYHATVLDQMGILHLTRRYRPRSLRLG